MARFWHQQDNSVARHIDQHSKAAANEITKEIYIGDAAGGSSFERTIWVPNAEGFVFRRMYLTNDADVPSQADGWEITLLVIDGDGREKPLALWMGDERGFAAYQPYRIPVQSDLSVPLKPGEPIRVNGISVSGSPDLTGFHVEFVIALA